jgi:murein tripeptide amidase MpaA
MAIAVSGRIPQGSIEVVAADDPANIQLRLVPDANSQYLGYFHFRATGVRGVACNFALVNASDSLTMRLPGRDEAAVENGWTNTGAMASYDRRYWFRVPATFDGKAFRFRHRPDYDLCFYSSWPPYPEDRELDLLARAQLSPRVRLSVVGRSLDGADLNLLTIGETGPDKLKCWVIARQHPSEMQSGYFIEAFVDRMIDQDDAVVRKLLDRAVFYVVPNMNPDGARRGHTRMNAAGINLNREWVSPSLEKSPEVFHVRNLMEATGVDFALDCHADKELRCNFLGGPLEIPSRSKEMRRLFRAFERSWAAASPDYEPGHPYPGGSPETADLTMAWNWIGERFKCLSVLLEQPFKDTSWWQNKEQGWSPERAMRFGAAFPTALHGVIDRLR